MIGRLTSLDSEHDMTASEAYRTVWIACEAFRRLHPNLELHAKATEALKVLEVVVRDSDA